MMPASTTHKDSGNSYLPSSLPALGFLPLFVDPLDKTEFAGSWDVSEAMPHDCHARLLFAGSDLLRKGEVYPCKP